MGRRGQNVLREELGIEDCLQGDRSAGGTVQNRIHGGSEITSCGRDQQEWTGARAEQIFDFAQKRRFARWYI